MPLVTVLVECSRGSAQAAGNSPDPSLSPPLEGSGNQTMTVQYPIYSIYIGGHYFMEHSENTEQLCKPSLQCLISTNCILLDRAQQVLLAGTHTTGAWGLT